MRVRGLEVRMKKKFAVVLGSLAAVYMFVPEPTDIIPILGWVDEGVAGAMLLWSLKTLGVTPSAIFARMSGNSAVNVDERRLTTSA